VTVEELALERYVECGWNGVHCEVWWCDGERVGYGGVMRAENEKGE
jgi:hypothetical protein